jgi:hypothetical protein
MGGGGSETLVLNVFDSHLWDVILEYVLTLDSVDAFRELHRTFALVNRTFFDKVRNNRDYWEYAYYLTWKPKTIPMKAIHNAPLDLFSCCGVRVEYRPDIEYTTDPAKHYMCKHGFAAYKHRASNYSTFQSCYFARRCMNPNHYESMIIGRSMKSRYKDLFTRTARRWVNKHAKNSYRLESIRIDYRCKKRQADYYKDKADELLRQYKRAKHCHELKGKY